jgi:Reverse transcriptase (RNA-dependent DNA polymerase)
MCRQHGIILRHTPTEQHNALAQGEQMHSSLRRTFNKISLEFPNVPREVLLQLAVYALNTSANAHGLVPCLLVFGTLPRLPFIPETDPVSNNNILQILATAREEYERHVDEHRVAHGLKAKVPGATDITYEKGDSVYVYRDEARRWTGPYVVQDVEGKNVVLIVDTKGPKALSITRCKLAVPPYEVRWTETLTPTDPRANSALMNAAKREEILNLIRRGTFSLVTLPENHNENIVPSRFVLAIKYSATGEKKCKARFTVGGHKDRLKHSMVHTESNLSPTSIRMLLAVASILGMDIWCENVKQAYLQSAERLRCKIFVKPGIMQLGKDEFLQLLLPLYGLTEAGDYWSQTLVEHCVGHAQYEQSATDPSFFFRHVGQALVGLSGNYVNDILRAAPPKHRQKLQQLLREQFECADSSELPTTFIGLELSRTERAIHDVMKQYIHKLDFLPTDATFEEYASLRACLLWLSHARPGVAAFASVCASDKKEDVDAMAVSAMNKKLARLKDTSDLELCFPALDVDTLHMVVFVDSSFANRRDKSSQLGYVVCLRDKTGTMCILGYRSCKSWLVVRSAMAAETLAFTAAFDAAFSVRDRLEKVLKRNVPITMYTDSKALYDVLNSNRATTEARLMIDLLHVSRMTGLRYRA